MRNVLGSVVLVGIRRGRSYLAQVWKWKMVAVPI